MVVGGKVLHDISATLEFYLEILNRSFNSRKRREKNLLFWNHNISSRKKKSYAPKSEWDSYLDLTLVRRLVITMKDFDTLAYETSAKKGNPRVEWIGGFADGNEWEGQ